MVVIMQTLEEEAVEIVTVKTLSSIIDTPIGTIRNWCSKGQIPYVKLPTGGVRFHLPTIRQWYKSGTVDTCR